MRAVPSHRLLLWMGLAGYALTLLLERIIYVDRLGIPVAWFATGWLAAGLVVHHRQNWPTGIAGALILTAVWYLLILDYSLTDSLWMAVSTSFTAAVIGGSVELVLKPEHRGAVAQYIFPLMGVVTLGVMIVYGFGSLYFPPFGQGGFNFPLANALGLGIGVAIAGAAGILLGMPVRRSLRRSPARIIAAALSTLLLLVSSSVSVARFPDQWFELLAPYQYTWRTLAVCGGVFLTIIVGPVQVILTILSAFVIVGFFLRKHFAELPRDEAIVFLVEGQALMVAIGVITLLCTALMNSQRRTRRLANANQEIAHWIQRAHVHIPRHILKARIRQIERALEIAGEYCGASICAIYQMEPMERDAFSLTIQQMWVDPNPQVQPSVIAPSIDSRVYPELRERLLSTESWFMPAEAKVRPEWASAFVSDLSLQVSIMPMSFDGEVGGAIVMVSHPRARIRDYDVDSLLATIRDHYMGYQNHANALRSMYLYQRQLRELTARLSDAAEGVRRETSVELHDGLVQRLAVARMKLGELSQRRVSTPETIDTITQIIDDALSATRGIIRDLSTSVLYELGLIPALQELTQNLDQVGDIAISLEEEGERIALSEPLRVMFFTTIRELLDNSRMHAECRNVWIKVRWDKIRGVSLVEVSDDGHQQGWWLGKTSSSDLGLGIAGISEQLRRFGYELKFDFRPGGGTKAMIV